MAKALKTRAPAAPERPAARPAPDAPGPEPAGSEKTGLEKAGAGRAGAAERVQRLREAWRSDRQGALLNLALAQAVTIAVLVTLLIVTILWKSQDPVVIAMTADQKVIELQPLDQPNMTAAALSAWTAMAVVEIMTFGFHDVEMRLESARAFFTEEGWTGFRAALDESGFLENVRTRQQVVSTAPQGAPVLTNRFEERGRWNWVMQLPILITTQSGEVKDSQRRIVTLIVERVPTQDNPSGVGIRSWMTSEN